MVMWLACLALQFFAIHHCKSCNFCIYVGHIVLLYTTMICGVHTILCSTTWGYQLCSLEIRPLKWVLSSDEFELEFSSSSRAKLWHTTYTIRNKSWKCAGKSVLGDQLGGKYTVLHIFRQVLFGAGNQSNHQNFEKSLLSCKCGLIFIGTKHKKGSFSPFLSLCRTAWQPYRLSHINALHINQSY